MKTLTLGAILIAPLIAFAQVQKATDLNPKYTNWHNLDWQANSVAGISLDRAFKEILAKKSPRKTIIVAVMDSGVDIDHEDLKDNIWINEDEIPGNNLDDDNNGYVDDIHGWKFLGNNKGENISYETYEFTRLVKSTTPSNQNNPIHIRAKKLYDTELTKRTAEKENLDKFIAIYEKAKAIIKNKTGLEVHNKQDLEKVKTTGDQDLTNAKNFLANRYGMGLTEEDLAYLVQNNRDYLEKFLNLNYEPRKIIGDNPTDITDAKYGNNDVTGARADHGTAVAGVIAAIRDNDLGINGILSHVKIMSIRTTPRGDERDKDVALGIRYAIANGAHIINMSFGKDISPEKYMVDEAVRLAEEKGVLIVHASGNDGINVDQDENYPSDRYLDGTEPQNWIEVGASCQTADEKLAAVFSNYGSQHVDIFAPGENIASLDTGNYYNLHDGTSLAAPVVTGVAALLLSYYPDLSTKQLIDIMLQSSAKYPKLKVLEPNLASEKRSKVKFAELSKSGGVVNVYNAILEAEKISSGSN
jgi:subtilisin family serine protease